MQQNVVQKVSKTKSAGTAFVRISKSGRDHATQQRRAADFAGVQEIESRKIDGLEASRFHSPVSCYILSKISGTVIPHLLKDFLTWFVLVVFIVTAFLSRVGWYKVDPGQDIMSFSKFIIAFFIVSYLSYAVSRYYMIYMSSQVAMGRIFDLCMLARAQLNSDDRHQFWRYLNLTYLAAVTGASSAYNVTNLFNPYCEKWGLTLDNSEQQRLCKIDLSTGGRAYREFMSWAHELLAAAQKRGDITNVEKVTMQDRLFIIRAELSFFFDVQVLPLTYSHLVGCCNFFSLSWHAFREGLKFKPEAIISNGLVLPLLSVLIASLALLGLSFLAFEMMNPVGSGREDLTLIHALEFTTAQSKHIVSPLGDEEGEVDPDLARSTDDAEDEEEREAASRQKNLNRVVSVFKC